jgi:hypothetical protein
MVIRSSCILFLFFFLISCGSETFDSPKEMLAYINDGDNGFKQSKIINGVEYTLLYKPTDLLVIQELTDEKNKEYIEKLREKYSRYMYFNLEMAMNEKEVLSNVVKDKVQFGQMVNDLAFGFADKVNLFTPKKDTLIVKDFVYSRMFGMTKSTSIMIVYVRDKKYLNNEYLNFTIEDFGLNTGEVKFKINTRSIVNEPQLRFN